MSFASCKTTVVDPITTGSSSTIQYTLGANSYVHLTVENAYGTTVSTLVDGRQNAGLHIVTFSISGLPEGLYYSNLSINSNLPVRTMMIWTNQ